MKMSKKFIKERGRDYALYIMSHSYPMAMTLNERKPHHFSLSIMPS